MAAELLVVIGLPLVSNQVCVGSTVSLAMVSVNELMIYNLAQVLGLCTAGLAYCWTPCCVLYI